MTHLFAAIACSLATGVIFKFAATRQYDRLALLTSNYVVASLFSLLIILRTAEFQSSVSGPFLILAILTGFVFIGGYFLFSMATEYAGLGLGIAVMRLSVVIPFMGSWFIWREEPTVLQILGAALACIAIWLITYTPEGKRQRVNRKSPLSIPILLILLFVVGSMSDMSMKIFEESFASTASKDLFMLIIFGVSALIGLVLMARNNVNGIPALHVKSALTWGAILGIVNLGSVVFFLRAIAALDGTVVFPVNSVSLVLGGALIGRLVWSEKLTPLNIAGLIVAAVAVALISS